MSAYKQLWKLGIPTAAFNKRPLIRYERNHHSRPQCVDCVRMVHLVRNCLKYVGYKERKAVADDLRKIYTAATREAAEQELERFAAKWDGKFASIGAIWRRNWERVSVFFAYPEEIRRVIYTTNAIESVNMSLRKIIRNRGSFPNDEAALKLIYLALENISEKWTMPIREWKAALNRFAIVFGERLPYV